MAKMKLMAKFDNPLIAEKWGRSIGFMLEDVQSGRGEHRIPYGMLSISGNDTGLDEGDVTIYFDPGEITPDEVINFAQGLGLSCKN